jgi:Flp pilus assembly pilin Flp
MTVARMKRCRRAPGLLGHLARLHKDERGVEGVELILIIAAIALPLLGLLIIFRKEVKEWVQGVWERARGSSDSDIDDYFDSSTSS